MARRRSIRGWIAQEAAQIIAAGKERDFTQAKRRAARVLGVRFSTDDFPSTREIRDALRQIESLADQATCLVDLRRMRLHALRLMNELAPHPAWLVGPLLLDSVATGLESAVHVQTSSSPSSIPILATAVAVESRDLTPNDEVPSRRDVLLWPGEYIVKVIVADTPPKEAAWSREELFEKLAQDGPVEHELQGLASEGDRFEIMEDLARGLETIRLDPREHPEGDALYHALQLFDEVAGEHPYDEELLTAALLHDVGRVHSPADPIGGAKSLLGDLVTHRTLRLIEGLELVGDGPAPSSHQRSALVGSEDADDFQLLLELDKKARRVGVETSSLEEAIETLRSLDADDLS